MCANRSDLTCVKEIYSSHLCIFIRMLGMRREKETTYQPTKERIPVRRAVLNSLQTPFLYTTKLFQYEKRSGYS